MSDIINKTLRDVIGEVLETSLTDDSLNKYKLKNLGINSISFIKLVVIIEQKFGIEFEDDKLDFNSYDTFDSIVAYIRIKVEGV